MASQRSVNVGGVQIGGGAPVVVQTMTKTETANLQATMDQIRRVAEAGADIVRVAVPREKDIEALKTIVVESPIPIIADIHFNHTLALKAIEAGAHCVRLKWMSAITGIGDSRTIVLSASTSLSRGTATRTRSAPASATRRIWSIVAVRFAVSVLVIVWTTTGAPPPIWTPPTFTCRLEAMPRPR